MIGNVATIIVAIDNDLDVTVAIRDICQWQLSQGFAFAHS